MSRAINQGGERHAVYAHGLGPPPLRVSAFRSEEGALALLRRRGEEAEAAGRVVVWNDDRTVYVDGERAYFVDSEPRG